MNKLIRILPVGVVSAVVLLLIIYSTLNDSPMGGYSFHIPGADKVVHALMFFTMVCALAFDITKMRFPRRLRWRGVIALALVSSAFGGIIEFFQDWMGLGRSMEFNDWVADTVGAVLGVCAWKLIFSPITVRSLEGK